MAVGYRLLIRSGERCSRLASHNTFPFTVGDRIRACRSVRTVAESYDVSSVRFDPRVFPCPAFIPPSRHPTRCGPRIEAGKAALH
jgi:hypothetical protein